MFSIVKSLSLVSLSLSLFERKLTLIVYLRKYFLSVRFLLLGWRVHTVAGNHCFLFSGCCTVFISFRCHEHPCGTSNPSLWMGKGTSTAYLSFCQLDSYLSVIFFHLLEGKRRVKTLISQLFSFPRTCPGKVFLLVFLNSQVTWWRILLWLHMCSGPLLCRHFLVINDVPHHPPFHFHLLVRVSGPSYKFLKPFDCGLSISSFLFHSKSNQENRNHSKYLKNKVNLILGNDYYGSRKRWIVKYSMYSRDEK